MDPTNWPSDNSYLPLSFTNISGSPFQGDISTRYALMVDTTNAIPAQLRYNLVETNGATNLTLDVGSVTFWFSAASWASASTNGTGPGAWAELLSVGQWTTNASFGYWGLSIDPGGTNVYFASQDNTGSNATYLSVPITWNTNEWHFIGLTYSATNSALYLDGKIATNGVGVTVLPGASVLTNGFFIGSDKNGFAQARGLFDDIYTFGSSLTRTDMVNIYGSQAYDYFLNPYNIATANIASAPSSPTYTGTWDAITGPGFLLWVTNTASCTTSSNVWITNMVATIVGTGTNQTVNYTFTIAGGIDGAPYDVFATSILGPAAPIGSTNGITWSWMGQGYHCNTYMLTNMPLSGAFFILGTPQNSDLDGLTDAYERLVSHTDPNSYSTDGTGMSDGWEILYFGHTGIDPNADPDGDGLTNYQEYMGGTNPLVPDNYNIVLTEPKLGSNLP